MAENAVLDLVDEPPAEDISCADDDLLDTLEPAATTCVAGHGDTLHTASAVDVAVVEVVFVLLVSAILGADIYCCLWRCMKVFVHMCGHAVRVRGDEKVNHEQASRNAKGDGSKEDKGIIIINAVEESKRQ
jgi:hypothetical protein